MNADGPLFQKRKHPRQHSATPIGTLFRNGRLARGMHQDVFAKAIGVTRRQMSAIELGDMIPQGALLFKLTKHGSGVILADAVLAYNDSVDPQFRLMISGDVLRPLADDAPQSAIAEAPADSAEALNRKLAAGYAARVDAAAIPHWPYADFVRAIEQLCPAPENEDHRAAWSRAIEELYRFRKP